MRIPLGVLAFLALASAAIAGEDLVNPSFESGLDGWDEMIGATLGDGDARPDVAVVDDIARDGVCSLRVTGTAGTIRWPLQLQRVDVAAGHRVTLRVAARCEGVAQTGRQYGNSNAVLMFEDAAGNRLGFHTSPVLSGDRDWVDLTIDAIAPAGTTRAAVGVFHSMSGTAWFDDVRLTVASTDVTDEAARAAAYAALAGHLRRTWPFWGLDGKPDADALFLRHREAVTGAADLSGFVAATREMLAELDDVHVWMDTPAGRIGTARPGPGNRFDPRVVIARLDETVVHGRNVLAGWIGKGDDRVGYLLVATFAPGDPEWPLVEQALDALSGAEAVIVDVRPNGGGDETRAQAIASRWTAEPVTYAQQRFRDPTVAGLDGFLGATTRVLEPAGAEQRFDGRVVVLAGPGCVSSTEGFLLMCKALPRVTVVGQPSRGASGNPGPFVLLPGVTVWSSRWQALDPAGAPIEGRGVAPDVAVELADGEPSPTSDPVLDRALALLRE